MKLVLGQLNSTSDLYTGDTLTITMHILDRACTFVDTIKKDAKLGDNLIYIECDRGCNTDGILHFAPRNSPTNFFDGHIEWSDNVVICNVMLSFLDRASEVKIEFDEASNVPN